MLVDKEERFEKSVLPWGTCSDKGGRCYMAKLWLITRHTQALET
jgi:hypothetical protein